jgi:hypothetical protein
MLSKVNWAAVARKVQMFAFVLACAVVLTVSAHATANDGTSAGVTYGLGELGGPAATDYQTGGSGFLQSLAPILVALIPVMCLGLAIFMGPKILKKVAKMAVGG